MSVVVPLKTPFTEGQEAVFTFVLEGNVQPGPHTEVEGAKGLDDGLDPADVEDGSTAVFLPAAEAVVELEQAAKALGVLEKVLCKQRLSIWNCRPLVYLPSALRICGISSLLISMNSL